MEINKLITNLAKPIMVSDFVKDGGLADIKAIEKLIIYVKEMDESFKSGFCELVLDKYRFYYRPVKGKDVKRAILDDIGNSAHLNQAIVELIRKISYIHKYNRYYNDDISENISLLDELIEGNVKELVDIKKQFNLAVNDKIGLEKENKELKGFVNSFWYKCYKFFKRN